MLNNKVRIIAGKLRRRFVHFPESESIRPTPDRIRETVFNWLNPYLKNTVCLDCFAGSGILGFEAVSRGAKHVYFIDSDKKAVAMIKHNATELKVDNTSALICDLPRGLARIKETLDVIFLDPPYKSNLVKTTIAALEENKLLKEGTLLYIEQSSHHSDELNAAKFEIIKENATKRILYRLLRYTK